MTLSRRIFLVAALSAFVTSAQAQDLTSKLDYVLTGYEKNRAFIGSALVAKGGKTILEKGYGMANIELGVPNGPDTKFRLGSITKQFTATAILQLEEQGKLSVNDLACKYVAECPESWKAITIHQLLTHTSGIPSYTNGPEFTKPRMMRIPLSPMEVLTLTKDKPLEFQPGEKFKYDNSGYVFLGVIIEKVSGEKYADYLKKHIFGPLDMQDSGYDDTSAILKNRAAGYRSSDNGEFHNAEYLDMSLPYSAGSLYSTVRDLARWDRALYTGKVLSKASREKMWTPVKNNYGYGWDVRKDGHKQLSHGGGINGFSTFIARYPDDDAVVIVLSNNQQANTAPIAIALAGVLFGEGADLPWERKQISVAQNILDRYAGAAKY
ncbi:MAG TPA: serine hydrolase domain-containing protein [Bryobacteraceae bacterium]|nr:serine hydrolase domain-containing protein [Bryobacteraceae bacterium]